MGRGGGLEGDLWRGGGGVLEEGDQTLGEGVGGGGGGGGGQGRSDFGGGGGDLEGKDQPFSPHPPYLYETQYTHCLSDRILTYRITT